MLKFIRIFFAYQGKTRTIPDNIVSAISLSCVAGIVNIVGYLTVKELSTNVTGHFAFMVNEFSNSNVWKGLSYFFYIFSFLLGSITATFLLNLLRNSRKINVYAIPILIEIFLLLLVIFYYLYFSEAGLSNFLVTEILLFSMGMQNAYVTKISDAVVRTTHVTGLFTDLGIEIVTFFTNKNEAIKKEMKSAIVLRFYIIIFFLSGGLAAGFFYSVLNWKIKTLFLAIIILLFYLFYDAISFQLKLLKKRYAIKL